VSAIEMLCLAVLLLAGQAITTALRIKRLEADMMRHLDDLAKMVGRAIEREAKL
jgi:hypothetical protein